MSRTVHQWTLRHCLTVVCTYKGYCLLHWLLSRALPSAEWLHTPLNSTRKPLLMCLDPWLLYWGIPPGRVNTGDELVSCAYAHGLFCNSNGRNATAIALIVTHSASNLCATTELCRVCAMKNVTFRSDDVVIRRYSTQNVSTAVLVWRSRFRILAVFTDWQSQML
jgi:hypothetical protein